MSRMQMVTKGTKGQQKTPQWMTQQRNTGESRMNVACFRKLNRNICSRLRLSRESYLPLKNRKKEEKNRIGFRLWMERSPLPKERQKKIEIQSNASVFTFYKCTLSYGTDLQRAHSDAWKRDTQGGWRFHIIAPYIAFVTLLRMI